MTEQDRTCNAFLTSHQSEAEALQCADIASSIGVHIHGAIIAFNGDFDSVRQVLNDGRSRLRGIKLYDGVVPAVEVKRLVKKPAKRWRIGKAIIIADSDARLLYLLSTDRRDDFDFAVEAILGRIWQLTARVFLRTPQISRALAGVSRWPSVTRMRVLEYTSRTVRDDDGIRRKVETERHWANLSVDQAFQRLAADGQWLTSILFSVRHADYSTRVRLLRNGSFTCDAGFLPFWLDVRPAITAIVIETNRFFERRDKQSSPTGHIRPLRIGYAEPVFADKQSNRRLINVLRSLGSSSVSVWHPNPYLYASILDYVDGSSCDVLVAHHDAILMIPQFRASAASLQRICNHICDNFQEGKIIEF